MKPHDESIARLLAGDPDDAGKQAIARQFAADPEAREKLGNHMLTESLLSVALEDEFSRSRRHSQLMDTLRKADQDDFLASVHGKIQRRTWRRRLLASAAVILFGAVALFLLERAPSSDVVAKVTRLETLAWGTDTPIMAGEYLKKGSRLRFGSGLVELDMAGRGRMIVEGPADLELMEPMRSVLHRGRILMRVTTGGHGYRLETSKGSVIDLGTEFGVSVDEQQEVETHVLDGEVEAMPDGGKKVLLKKNDALRFSGGNGERIPADGGAFYTTLPPENTETTPVIHWPLESTEDGRDLAEVRGFDTTNSDMRLSAMDQGVAPTPVEGVFGRALAFDGKGGFAESDFPGIGGRGPRTVGFWVKVPQDFNPREGFGIVSWGQFTGNNFGKVWQIAINPLAADGPIGHLRVGAHGGQIVGGTDLRDGRWHHVAVVLYDATRPDIGKHVLIYLDGELETISRRSLQEVDTQVLGASHGVWLGRNVAYNHSAPDHQHGGFFRGVVDEVFIIAGALSHDEIRELMKKNELPR